MHKLRAPGKPFKYADAVCCRTSGGELVWRHLAYLLDLFLLPLQPPTFLWKMLANWQY